MDNELKKQAEEVLSGLNDYELRFIIAFAKRMFTTAGAEE